MEGHTRKKFVSCWFIKALTCFSFLHALVLAPTIAFANPQNGTVSSGAASIISGNGTTQINQTTKKAVINWDSFDIGKGEQTRFNQPDACSLTLNRIHDMKPSKIEGNLSANGRIVLVNPNGVFFDAGSIVDVNGLVATTAGISDNDFMNKSKMNFNIAGNPDAAIINHGTISAGDAGLIGLVAPQVENHGLLKAKLGKVHMASGDTFTLDMAGDGLITVAADGNLQKQLVKNTGTVSADGGQIYLTAAAVRQQVNSLIENTGVIRAKSFAQKKR